MNAIHRSRPGQWGASPDLTAPKPPKRPEVWAVLWLSLSPLMVIGAVSLIAVAITNYWK
jgi:hypothetical protein